MKPVIEFEEDANHPRQNYRVKPMPNDPIKLLVAGREMEIIDLSVKGVAFRYAGETKQPSYPIELLISVGRRYQVACELRIVRHQDDMVSGVFEALSARDETVLNKLVMALQRRDIREATKRKDDN